MKLTSAKVIGLLGTLAVALSASGCRHSRPYLGPAWYNVYGQVCAHGAPSPGCNFYWNGAKIVDIDDPYFHGYYNLSWGLHFYTDSYGWSSSYLGWAWRSPNGILYDQYGYALNEKGSQEGGTDLVNHVDEQEQQVVQDAADNLATTYELSAEVSYNMAKTLNTYANHDRYHQRTPRDEAAYTKQFAGIDMNDAVRALAAAKAGDGSELVTLNKQVAGAWKVDEEKSERILRKFYEDQLKDYGL